MTSQQKRNKQRLMTTYEEAYLKGREAGIREASYSDLLDQTPHERRLTKAARRKSLKARMMELLNKLPR